MSGNVLSASVAFALVGQLAVTGVLLILRAARLDPRGRQAHSLSMLWIPVLFAVPVAMIVVGLGKDLSGSPLLWLVTGPSTTGALFGLAVVMCRSGGADHAREVSRVLPSAQIVMLAALGAIALFLAWSNRIHFMHGQVLFTLGVIWMWSCSVDRPPASGTRIESCRNARLQAGKRPLFLLDWGSQDRDRSMPGALTGFSVLSLAILPFLVGPAQANGLGGVLLVTTGSLTGLSAVAAGCMLSPLLGQRFCVSTLALAQSFGLGATGLSLFPMAALRARMSELLHGEASQLVFVQASEIYGLRLLIVSATSLLFVAALVSMRRGRARQLTAILAFLCAMMVALSGSDRGHALVNAVLDRLRRSDESREKAFPVPPVDTPNAPRG